jgi:hypothetical protein
MKMSSAVRQLTWRRRWLSAYVNGVIGSQCKLHVGRSNAAEINAIWLANVGYWLQSANVYYNVNDTSRNVNGVLSDIK